MNKPIPVIRDGSGKLICDYDRFDWFSKLNEELNEVKVAIWDFENYEDDNTYDEAEGLRRVAEELQDLKTVCTSMQSWLGYDEKARDKIRELYSVAPDEWKPSINSAEWITAMDMNLDLIKMACLICNSWDIVQKLQILISACTAIQMKYCNFDEVEIDKICAKVNEKNEKRGYFSKE